MFGILNHNQQQQHGHNDHNIDDGMMMMDDFNYPAAGVPPMHDPFQPQQQQQHQQDAASSSDYLDSHKMQLTDAELEWALEIKDALLNPTTRGGEDDSDHEEEDSERIVNITDFEIAQLAIVTLGLDDDLEEVLESIRERVFALQCLKQEYGLEDTAEEGVELMKGLTCEQQPGHILAFDLAPDKRSYIGVFDFAKNKPSAVDLPNDWRIYLGGYYYLLSAACSNFTTIREGFVSIVECEGMSYKTFSHKMQQRWSQELGMHYPITTKESLWCNTPLVANVMCAFVKPWMNSHASRWDKIRMGCQMDWFDGRLDQLMNVPTQQVAQTKLLHNLHSALTERFHHYKTFVLPERPSNTLLEEEFVVEQQQVAAQEDNLEDDDDL